MRREERGVEKWSLQAENNNWDTTVSRKKWGHHNLKNYLYSVQCAVGSLLWVTFIIECTLQCKVYSQK